MKKFKFLLMLVSVLVITACGSENKKASDTEATNETAETTDKSKELIGETTEITGKWKADLWHIEGAFEDGDFVADGTDMGNITVTFKKDGTFVSDGAEFTTKFTVNAEGMKFSNEASNKNPFNSGTWKREGAVLKMKNDVETAVYDYHIDKLTSKTMIMSMDDYKLDEGDIEGTFKAKMGFKR